MNTTYLAAMLLVVGCLITLSTFLMIGIDAAAGRHFPDDALFYKPDRAQTGDREWVDERRAEVAVQP